MDIKLKGERSINDYLLPGLIKQLGGSPSYSLPMEQREPAGFEEIMCLILDTLDVR